MGGAGLSPVRRVATALALTAGLCAAAAERAGAARARSVMVGDTVTDREAARAAGLPCVLMDMGVSADVVAELDAEVVLDRYADLPAALDRLRPPD